MTKPFPFPYRATEVIFLLPPNPHCICNSTKPINSSLHSFTTPLLSNSHSNTAAMSKKGEVVVRREPARSPAPGRELYTFAITRSHANQCYSSRRSPCMSRTGSGRRSIRSLSAMLWGIVVGANGCAGRSCMRTGLKLTFIPAWACPASWLTS